MEEGVFATVVRPSTVRPSPVRETEREEPRFWHVVLLDDDEHTYDYVIRLVMEVFSQKLERAFEIAQKVDQDGRAVLLTTHKEHAELKLEQVQAFGKDELIASCSGAMSAVLEPACYAGDDDDG